MKEPEALDMAANKKVKPDEPRTSPFGRKLLDDLRKAGDTGLNATDLKIPGAKEELKKLCKLGYALSLDNSAFISTETYEKHARAILRNRKPGERLSISDARDSTGLSRKFLLPILNRMEREGYVRREGDIRIVTSIDGRKQ